MSSYINQDVNQKELQNRLWIAAANGDCKTIRVLTMSGVDIDARNAEGFTAFNVATQHGHSEAATTILAAREMQFAQKLGEDPAEFYQVKTEGQKRA